MRRRLASTPRIAVCAAAAVAGLGAAEPAAGQSPVPVDGLTAQRSPMTLIVTPSGRVSFFTIPWRTTHCRRPPATLAGDTSPRGALSLSTRRRFVERVRVVTRDVDDQFVSTISVEVRGQRLRGRHRWTGTISAQSVVRRRGAIYDRCRLAPVRWNAAAHTGTLDLTSEPDNWVGPESPLHFDHRTAALSSIAASQLEVQFRPRGDAPGPWTVRLRPRDLRPGRYRGDVVEVSGDARGCGTPIVGELVIEKIRLDALRRIRQVSATFSQRCTYDSGLLRGRLEFRRGY